MSLVYINARGTIISIPKTLAQQSTVLVNSYNNFNNSTANNAYYVNYSEKTIHRLLDYLNGENIVFSKIEKAATQLGFYTSIIYNTSTIQLTQEEILASPVANGKKTTTTFIALDEYLTYLSYIKGYHLVSLVHQSDNNKLLRKLQILVQPNIRIAEFDEILAGAKFIYDTTIYYKYEHVAKEEIKKTSTIDYISTSVYACSDRLQKNTELSVLLLRKIKMNK